MAARSRERESVIEACSRLDEPARIWPKPHSSAARASLWRRSRAARVLIARHLGGLRRRSEHVGCVPVAWRGLMGCGSIQGVGTTGPQSEEAAARNQWSVLASKLGVDEHNFDAMELQFAVRRRTASAAAALDRDPPP